MTPPSGTQFNFIELISDHPHVQTWRAQHIEDGHVCVLKHFHDNGDADSSIFVSTAVGSYRLQRQLSSHKAILARHVHVVHDGVLVEYPYMNPDEWTAITHSAFLSHWKALLPAIALAIDHLHLLGLVHGDLKLGNIFWQPFSSDPEIKIADLDFLQKELSVPSARLFGTPGLIAPELEANECIVAQSDLFSLGKSMQRAVADLADDAPQDSTLLTLVELLTQSEYILRPRILLDALHSCGILSDEQLGKANCVLLGMLFRSHLTQACRKQLRQGKVDRLLSDLRLLGIPLELKELAASAFIVHSKHTWSVCRRLLMRSVIGRTGEYFSCVPTQPDIDEALNELDCLIAPTGSMSRSKSGDEIFETARQLRKQGRPLYADRILRELLQTGLATSITIPILRERANCATDLARHSESCKLSRQAAERGAHQEALRYLISSFTSSGKEMDPGTRDAYFENIAKETAWLDAAKAGRQTSHGRGGHWPDDHTLSIGHMSGEARYRFQNSARIYAWGYGGSEKEATYYRYHNVAQQLALKIRRETDEEARAQLQEAAQLLDDIMRDQFTMVAKEQATWKETQQALQDLIDPEAAWREAPQVPTSEPLKPAETPETTTT